MNSIKKEIGYVVVSDSSRIGRSHKDIAIFRNTLSKLGLRLIFSAQKAPEPTAADNFREAMILIISQFDSEKRSEKIKQGLMNKKLKGMNHKALVPRS